MEHIFTYHKIHPFKVYNSVVFSRFTELCNPQHHIIPEHFYPQRDPGPISSHSSFPLPPPPAPWQPLIYFVPWWIWLFWTLHINWISLYAAFCVWLLSHDSFCHLPLQTGTEIHSGLFQLEFFSSCLLHFLREMSLFTPWVYHSPSWCSPFPLLLNTISILQSQLLGRGCPQMAFMKERWDAGIHLSPFLLQVTELALFQWMGYSQRAGNTSCQTSHSTV